MVQMAKNIFCVIIHAEKNERTTRAEKKIAKSRNTFLNHNCTKVELFHRWSELDQSPSGHPAIGSENTLGGSQLCTSSCRRMWLRESRFQSWQQLGQQSGLSHKMQMKSVEELDRQRVPFVPHVLGNDVGDPVQYKWTLWYFEWFPLFR